MKAILGKPQVSDMLVFLTFIDLKQERRSLYIFLQMAGLSVCYWVKSTVISCLSPHVDPEGLVQTHPGVQTHVER